MICSIHQPNFIPYLGLFDKISQSDIFVFYDTAQYTKGDYHNRNFIKGGNGKITLTLPISLQFGQKISEVSFDRRVLHKFLQTLQQSYKKTPFYSEIYPFVEDIFSYQSHILSEFNENAIIKICNYLSIEVQFFRTSDFEKSILGTSTDALIEICSYVGADTYISGSGGRGYIEESKFQTQNITLFFQDFHHPVYPQHWGDFLPYLSVIDALFYLGKDTKNILSH